MLKPSLPQVEAVQPCGCDLLTHCPEAEKLHAKAAAAPADDHRTTLAYARHRLPFSRGLERSIDIMTQTGILLDGQSDDHRVLSVCCGTRIGKRELLARVNLLGIRRKIVDPMDTGRVMTAVCRLYNARLIDGLNRLTRTGEDALDGAKIWGTR